MNSVGLIGRLVQEPDVRYTKNGKAVASFTMAVARSYGGQAQTEVADFIPIVAWGTLGELCGNHLAKGQRIFVQGRMQVRSYEAADGQKRRVSEIVAEFVARGVEADNGMAVQEPVNSAMPADFSRFGHEVVNEKIPF